MTPKNAALTFKEIIDLTEKTTTLMESFGELEIAEQEAVLTDAFKKEMAELGENDELPFRMVRTAEMMIGVGTPKVAVLLAEGLDHENQDVKMLAGDVLMHLAEHGLEAVMPAVDAVLKKGGSGAEEMPFILAELDDAEAPKLIERFLLSKNPNVVAAALEAIAECGDEDSIPAVKKLVGDKREVEIEDGPSSEETTTIGQLASDAIDMLSDDED